MPDPLVFFLTRVIMQDTVGAVEQHAKKHGIDCCDMHLWMDEFSLRFPVSDDAVRERAVCTVV